MAITVNPTINSLTKSNLLVMLGLILGVLIFTFLPLFRNLSLQSNKATLPINFEKRPDGAIRVTNCIGSNSCQNPVFSPDSKSILFTRFKNNYNGGPSELVKRNISTGAETIVVPASGSDNVNVPFGSWMGNKITFSSDRGGASDEIFTANSDGTNLTQITNHPIADGHFIEPVFNPANPNKIVFELAPNSNTSPHHLKLLELDRGNKITDLTTDPNFNDQLPSWSKDGIKILWQRSNSGSDQFQIFVANINLGDNPNLSNTNRVSQSSSNDTDNSWAVNDQYILSSSDFGGITAPNIIAFPASGTGTPIRVTNINSKQDGAASYSPDGAWVAFESHSATTESDPAEIWLISASQINPITSPNPSASPTATPSSGSIYHPPLKTSWQIQFSGRLNQDINAQLFDIDGFDTPKSTVDSLHKKGKKVLCYINAGAWEEWRSDAASFPKSVKGNDLEGWPGEKWLDIRDLNTLGPIMAARMDICKQKSFDGVDPDNVDGFTNNTGFPLTYQDQITYNKFLADLAHKKGLSVGLKNDLDQIPDLVSNFDWELNEQCFQFDECNSLLPFINAGKPVFNIEYSLGTAKFCSKANSLNFNSIRKHLNLDSFRQACR